MPKYSFQARNPKGASQSGMLDAPTEAEALRQLRNDGLTVTDLRIASELIDVEQLRIRQAARNVQPEEVISFSAQMSVMLETGVPVSEALGAYVQQSKPGGFQRVVEVVRDRINSGVSFSGAIAEFPRAFPPMMVCLLRASEATGALAGMLSRVADYLGKERRTAKQIKGALAYPAVMIVMAFAVTGFLVGWVLPRFAKIYESRAAALPAPTRMLMGVSDVLVSNWIGLLVGLVAIGAAAYAIPKTKKGRYAIDWFKIHAPLLGPIYRNFYLSRAARTLGTLLNAGVTLPEAVKIVRGVTANELWREFWDEMHEAMTTGREISEVVLVSNLFPPSVGQMITAGERSGKLGDVLERIANVTEEDLDESIKNSTQMIEPLVITFMGVMIGGIAIALLLPIFSMGSMMSQ